MRSTVRLLNMCNLKDCDPQTAKRTIASAKNLADELGTGSAEQKREFLGTIIKRVEIQSTAVEIEVDQSGLAKALGIKIASPDTSDTGSATITLSIQLRRRGVEARLVLNDTPELATNADPNLIRLIGQAHRHLDQLTSGNFQTIAELAASTSSNPDEISRILPLAFLAPDIVKAILVGNQPIELTAKRLTRLDHLPIDWKDQRQKLGIS